MTIEQKFARVRRRMPRYPAWVVIALAVCR